MRSLHLQALRVGGVLSVGKSRCIAAVRLSCILEVGLDGATIIRVSGVLLVLLNDAMAWGEQQARLRGEPPGWGLFATHRPSELTK